MRLILTYPNCFAPCPKLRPSTIDEDLGADCQIILRRERIY